MKENLINKDPFSNSSDYEIFIIHNCEKCRKGSIMLEDGNFTNVDENNMPLCSYQYDMDVRMFDDALVKPESVEIADAFMRTRKRCPHFVLDRGELD